MGLADDLVKGTTARHNHEGHPPEDAGIGLQLHESKRMLKGNPDRRSPAEETGIVVLGLEAHAHIVERTPRAAPMR
jgi:hypothetical protein